MSVSLKIKIIKIHHNTLKTAYMCWYRKIYYFIFINIIIMYSGNCPNSLIYLKLFQRNQFNIACDFYLISTLMSLKKVCFLVFSVFSLSVWRLSSLKHCMADDLSNFKKPLSLKYRIAESCFLLASKKNNKNMLSVCAVLLDKHVIKNEKLCLPYVRVIFNQRC